jgi:hypothetical protein
MTRRPITLAALLTAATLVLAAAGPALAARQPDPTPIDAKAVRHPDLNVKNGYAHPGDLQGLAAERAGQDLQALGVHPDQARIDLRTGRWGTLILSRPLLPGRGNQLSWDQLAAAAPAGEHALGAAAWDAFRGWVERNRTALRLDPAELIQPGPVTTHRGGDFIQIYAPRQIGGVAVRDSYLTAVISGGNLVLFGAHNWGDVALPPAPDLTPAEAVDRVLAHVSPFGVTATGRGPALEYVPLARGEHDAVAVGEGLDYRLAWVVRPQIADAGLARWEALVDAFSGEVLLFEDTNHYGAATTRQVMGGVFPVSNDGAVPDGVEQAGWPMSGADVAIGGSTLFSDIGGNVATCVDGDITSTLSGQYVDMADQCGPISLTAAGNIDFGTSAGTDCTTPGFGGAGNTHASRSGFFELNQMIAQAQRHLPNNTWLTSTVTSNMNIPQSCNAFWNGATVNFYRSAPGVCSNTGELASVFDHEWGHGLDDNDAVPTVSSPGEGIADMYSYLRLATSCIGRGFLVGAPCGGYGDPCTVCDGVRDIDFANRGSGLPHTLSSTMCAPSPGTSCIACGAGPSPCGGAVHCEGAIYSEALFDLVNRDLPAQYGYDFNTSLEIAARLTYIGAGNVGTWYQCSPPFGGCAATGGYLNYLAADDDDMDLSNGTPHMQAIFDAFDRHELACATPTVADSGCAGVPTIAPAVNGSPLDRGALLTWGAVGGATKYQIFRTDGVFGCDFGKILVGETTGLSFADTGLQNGREYYYTVIPIGSHDACFGPASSCTSVTATAGANLSVVPNSAFYDELTGDLDGFIDNCENVRVYFGISNVGTGANTNLRPVSVTSPSHPTTTIDFPLEYADSLAACDTAIGWFDIRADALTTSGAIEFVVEVTSDELEAAVPGQVRTETFSLTPTEVDAQEFASRLWDFEANLDGWTVVDPIFNRTSHGAGGAGNGTQFSVDSSTALADQCDKIRSPFMLLEPTSTLSLWNNFDIEPFDPGSGSWYDRANLALEGADGSRTVVNPSGGRTYNVVLGGTGSFSGCNTGEIGWAGSFPSWASSTWSAGNFGGMAPGGPVQIEVTYSTDAFLQPRSFWFDQVEVTDLSLLIADTQGDVCPVNDLIFGDGFDGGSTAVWPLVVP